MSSIATWKDGGQPDPGIKASLDEKSFGDQLRARREASGLSLEILSKDLHISRSHLEAFERNERPEGLPMLFFRGQFVAYGIQLGMKREEAEQKFFWSFGTASIDPIEEMRARKQLPDMIDTSKRVARVRKGSGALGLQIMVLVLSAVGYFIYWKFAG